jgi:hypothetical protein
MAGQRGQLDKVLKTELTPTCSRRLVLSPLAHYQGSGPVRSVEVSRPDPAWLDQERRLYRRKGAWGKVRRTSCVSDLPWVGLGAGAFLPPGPHRPWVMGAWRRQPFQQTLQDVAEYEHTKARGRAATSVCISCVRLVLN